MSKRGIRIGDKVRFLLGNRPVIGEIREDRGPIGIGGRRLWGIVYELGEGNFYNTELPEVEFEVIEPKKEKA